MSKTIKEDIAYASGIIDGEGCIKIAKVRAEVINRPSDRYTLSIQVNMVDINIIKWLKKKFGGYFFVHKINIIKHPNWRDSYRWYLQNQHCEEFLKLILPYLKIKQKQAKLALRFIKLKPKDKRKELYYQQNRINNHVGRN